MMLKRHTGIANGNAARLRVELPGASFGLRACPNTTSLQANRNLTAVNIGSNWSAEHQQFSDYMHRQR
jgi:hypothetical protein